MFYHQREALLCQGNILANVPHAMLKPPLTLLRKQAIKGGGEGFRAVHYPIDQAADDAGPLLPPRDGSNFASGQPEQVASVATLASGIVLSHGCEIDKPDAKFRSVALVRAIPESLPESDKDTIRTNRNFSYFYLPAYAPTFSESYVDLRRISCLDASFIDLRLRIISLSDDSVRQLIAQLFLFVTRADIPQLDAIMLTAQRQQS